MRDRTTARESLTNELKTKTRRRRDTFARLAGAASPPPRNDLLPALELVRLSPEDLTVPSRNVRAADATQVSEIAASISALGFCDPVLIDQGRTIIDGAATVEAAKLLGLPEVPCIVIAHLKPAERRLLRMALNRLQEKGGWNLDSLRIEMQELMLEDMPLEITGFSGAEIDIIAMDEESPALETGPLAPPTRIPSVAPGGCLPARRASRRLRRCHRHRGSADPHAWRKRPPDPQR